MFKENQRSGFNPTAKNGPDGNYYGATEDATYSYGRRSGLFPTQDLVDCYLQKDDADGKWKIGGKLHRQKPWESIEMQKEN